MSLDVQGYLEYPSMSTSQLDPRNFTTWSICTQLQGFSGSIHPALEGLIDALHM